MHSTAAVDTQVVLLRRGRLLEYITLCWNVVGVVVLAPISMRLSRPNPTRATDDAVAARTASTVVLWELSGTGEERQHRALRLIGVAFVALAVYLSVQLTVALLANHHSSPSVAGIIWTGVTAVAMFALAFGKARTGRALGNPVLVTEGRVTFIDGLLAVAVLGGLALNLLLGWWWADPLAGYVIVYYAAREAVDIFRS